MEHALQLQQPRNLAQGLESVLLGGDLKALTPNERIDYYGRLCDSLGLNPLTKPFEYITLNGKLTLYARKDCTDQLRSLNHVSVTIAGREHTSDLMIVTARAKTPDGREDEAIGAVNVAGLKGEALANALMKAETKAKRRVTLSICGLGMTDEAEVESIPSARREVIDVTTGEIQEAPELGLSVFEHFGMEAIRHTTQYADGYVIKNHGFIDTEWWKGFIQTKAQREAEGQDPKKGTWIKGPDGYVPFFSMDAMPTLISGLEEMDASVSAPDDQVPQGEELFEIDESMEIPFND